MFQFDQICNITFPDDGNVFLYCVYRPFFRLVTALHSADRVKDYGVFFFLKIIKRGLKYCQISVLNQTRD